MKKYTKKEAIAVVVQCAEKYFNELEGKNLLFICLNKHKQTLAIELSFFKNNYMHLTGLKLRKQFESSTTSGLSANDFYQKCLEHKLSPADFDFADDGTTHMKLDILPKIICKNLGAKFIGDYNSAKPRLYTEKIVGNVHACMGFIFDCRLAKHVPNTLIREDARKLTSNSAQVIAVYRKEFYADRYTELTYKSRNNDCLL